VNSFFLHAPRGWKRVPLKYLAESPKNGAWGSEAGEDDQDAICVRVADFDWDRLSLNLNEHTVRSFKEAQVKNLRLEKDDIVIEKSGGGEKTPVGRMVRFDGQGLAVTSNFVARVRPQKTVDSAFLLYLLAAQYMSRFSLQFVKQSTGIQNLDDTALFRSDVWVPDISSQKRIAAFLDRETARIGELIVKKERLVAVLREGLLSELERLVTPDTPIHDQMIPFRWVCRITEGQVDPTAPEWADKPLIAPNHIESRTGRLIAIETAQDQGAISGKYAFPSGTVLYSKIRPNLAKACVATVEGMCSADMYPVLPDRRLRPQFLLMQLLSEKFTAWATLESMRVAMPKINRETLGGYRLWVPKLDVQDIAAEQFFAAQARNEALSDKVIQSIDRLREYRAALITAAVTGQIDVETYGKSGATSATLDQIEEEMQ
jgi:type I restriction enzyme S subunit